MNIYRENIDFVKFVQSRNFIFLVRHFVVCLLLFFEFTSHKIVKQLF